MTMPDRALSLWQMLVNLRREKLADLSISFLLLFVEFLGLPQNLWVEIGLNGRCSLLSAGPCPNISGFLSGRSCGAVVTGGYAEQLGGVPLVRVIRRHFERRWGQIFRELVLVKGASLCEKCCFVFRH
jgi:hypothetical protein